MSTPYVGTTDYGILTMTQQEIDEAVEDAHRHNFRVAIHANGDVTIDMVLKAYEKVLAEYPRPDTRHRIEHCSLVNPELLRRIKAIGAIPTPFWTYAHYHGEKWKEYGDEKMQWMFAHKSFLDAGIRVPGRVRLRSRAFRAADGASRAWSRARTSAATSGARGRRSPSTKR